MRLDYLRYFEHLAETLNYTKAAKDLYIAQPTLSVAIKRMEQELDIKLFQRSEGTTRIELTPAGRAFLEYASRALKDYDEGLRVAREMQGEVNSSIRVGTIYAMQGQFWSQAIQEFSETCSQEPKIEIEQAYSPALIRRLRSRDIDIAFASHVDGTSDLNYILVWSQPLVLAVNKANPLAKQKMVSISEIVDQDVLTYYPKSPVNAALEQFLPLDSMNVHRDFADEITMCSLVTSNKDKMALFCYSFLATAFPDVVCLRVRDLPADFHKVYLVSRRETHPRIVSRFIDFMSSYRFPNVMS